MDVNDLRAMLRDRADTVADDNDATERVAGVHARVLVARRKRVAGVAALTVGVLALVGTVSLLPDRAAPDRMGPADTAPTVQHENFVSHSGEYDLIAATVGEPGQNTLGLTVPAHRGRVFVKTVCYDVDGFPDGYWVSGYVGDTRPERPDSYWCGDDPDVPAVPGVFGTAPGPFAYPEGLAFETNGDRPVVRVELTREQNGAFVPVSNPDAVLGVAVYKVADPVATVAGMAIPPLVGLDGRDYSYVDHRQSQPGDRTLTWTLPPTPDVRYYDVVATDAMAPGTTGVGVISGLDGPTCQASHAAPRFRAGGCLLSPGEPHTITVTIQVDPPANAVLGIMLYRDPG